MFPLMTSGVAFWTLKALRHLGLWTLVGINSYTLLVSPRLLLTTFSFLLDYGVYQLAPLWGADPWDALALLGGSYVTLVFYTRTFANTVEGLLFTLLLVLVSLKATSKGVASIPSSRFIGIVTVAGFFNRPTFLAFALVPLLHWAGIIDHATSWQSTRRSLNCLLGVVPSAIFTAIVFIAVDTWFFTGAQLGLTLQSIWAESPASLLARLCRSIVVTPFNFVAYNLNPENLAQHGTHPHATHVAVNGVLLFGSLHLVAVRSACQLLKVHVGQLVWIRAPARRSTQSLAGSRRGGRPVLLAFYFVPLAFLSLFSHQEPRFLIPLLVPLVLLAAQNRQTQKWNAVNFLFNVWGALFFGCFHQGGIIPGLFHLEQLTHSAEALSHPTHYTLLFTHTYMPPRFLLNINKNNSLVELVDLAGTEKEPLCQILGSLTNRVACMATGLPNARTCQVVVIIPGTVRTMIDQCQLLVKNETVIFPHLTMEDPPQISFLLKEKWKNQLGLYILHLERKDDRT